MDLRCPSKLHGTLDNGLVEIKCNSRFCGAGPGRVILHRFDPTTGDLVETKQFKDPGRRLSDAPGNRSSVRSS